MESDIMVMVGSVSEFGLDLKNDLKSKIFNLDDRETFRELALSIFRFQYEHVAIYHQFVDLLKINPYEILNIKDIPFLPIEFFKTHPVLFSESENQEIFFEATFTSSGTTGMIQSKHFVKDLTIYETSFKKSFQYFYGNLEDYVFLALLPSYLEREGSSLVYMCDKFMQIGGNQESGFYLNELDLLYDKLIHLKSKKQKTILIGVTYALLDFVEKFTDFSFPELIVLETGGMKGKRREIVREELHAILKKGFDINHIHSEYGMTELLSQAYSKGEGIFKTPPWMSIIIRDTLDPFMILENEKIGGVNIIDLANIYSCSFLATQDLGRKNIDESVEILGRFDNADIRGCNLLLD